MNTRQLEAQAAEWLIRRESAGFTADDRAALDEWLAISPRHRAVYVRLQAAWGQAEQLRRLRPFDGTVDANLLKDSVLPSLRRAGRAADDGVPDLRRRARSYAIAAAVAALALLGAVFGGRAVIERFTGQVYATDIGGFQRVVLRDGSAVHMNTNSRMRVRISQARRFVVLDRGEALFAVARDTRRPFDVRARGTTIRATGTVFSVRLREAQGVDVLVTEGQVTIDPPEQAPERAAPLPPSSSTLSAGEAVTITAREELRVAKVDAAQLGRKMAWTEGRLLFEQQTLAEIAAEFNRYNRRQLAIADPAIANLRMSVGFDATDPESFVAALERTYGVRAFHSSEGGEDVVRLVGTDK